MVDPSMRVLAVLELLQLRERMSGAELAERLEVSVRTVQRYVARLQDLGVPVTSTRGPGGAYRLRPGYRLPPMMFATEEAFALTLGLDALGHLGLAEIAPAAAGARAKLERVLPEAVAARVAALRSALETQRSRWIVDVDVAILTELAAAVHDRRCVRMRYAARGREAGWRTVEPLGLVQTYGRWFLAAHCRLRGAPRLFRVDRAERVETSGEAFEPPAAFDLHAFVREGIAAASGRRRVEVRLGAPPDAVAARLLRGNAVLEPDGSDATVLRVGVDDLEAFALELLMVGAPVEVRRPAELVDAFAAVARRAAAVAARREAA